MRKDLGALPKSYKNRVQEKKRVALRSLLKMKHSLSDTWESTQRADQASLVLLCAEEPCVPSTSYRLCTCLLLDCGMFQLMTWWYKTGIHISESVHKVFIEGVFLFPKCKMLKLKFDASSVMTTAKKHQNYSVQIPEKKEHTNQKGCALLKAMICRLKTSGITLTLYTLTNRFIKKS